MTIQALTHLRRSAIAAALAIALGAAVGSCGVPDMTGADVLDITSPLDKTVLADAGNDATLADTLSALADSLLALKAVPMAVRGPGDYRRVFNDSNHVQLAAGQAIGITPLTDTRSFWNIRRPLRRIASNPDFVVAPLTHSKPYLVPQAADAVHEIGRRFNDSLRARGGGDYRIVVTSVLRTPADIRRLRRVNHNAVESSVHQMGTTVDIAYNRFEQGADTSVVRRTDDLKALLASVLADMRSEGRILVKYEVKQGCFHLTARP